MRIKKVLIALALSILLIGCEFADAPSLKESEPIRIGTNVWPGYEPLYLARELDQWSPQQFRLIEYPSASEVLRAFRNRSIEAASLTLDEILLLRQQNIPVSVVLIHDISDGGDVIIANNEIKEMSQLKGKRVGLEAGALGALVITRALELHGLSLDDIIVVNSDVNMHEEAFINGEVDAVVTFEPVRTRLLNHGGSEIFTSKEIPGEIVDVLAVHQNTLLNNPESIKQLTRSWFNALNHMKHNRNDAAKLIAQRLKITPQEVVDSYQGLKLPSLEENRKILGGENPSLQSTINQLNRVMVLNQLLDGKIEANDILLAAFFPTGRSLHNEATFWPKSYPATTHCTVRNNHPPALLSKLAQHTSK